VRLCPRLALAFLLAGCGRAPSSLLRRAASTSSTEVPAWQQVAGPPLLRVGHAMVYDSRRGVSVLFGGSAGGTLLGDTWEWNGSAWAQVATSGPAPRENHGLAFDSARSRVVLFGGGDATGNVRGDTWEWDGTTWSAIAAAGPSPRMSHGMSFDSTRGRTVVFGGWAGTGGSDYADTWEWDGTNWTPAPVSGPSARDSTAMVYDATRMRTVLYGGQGVSSELADTWEYDGSAWTASAATADKRLGHALAWDAARDRVVLYGGQVCNMASCNIPSTTWEYDGTNWTQTSTSGPPGTFSSALAWDQLRNDTVLALGGADTWLYAGGVWTQASLSGPPARDGAAMAWDSARKRTVLFGGFVSSVPLSDTWEWDGTQWSKGAGGPTGSQAFAMVYDSARAQSLLFDGTNTWSWDGTSWSQRATTGPPTRLHPAMAFDEARGRAVLYGGDWQTAFLDDTWEWDGSAWSPITSGAPSGRTRAAMAWDSSRQRTVLFGGYFVSRVTGSTPELGDTWEWDGSVWTQTASVGPAPRYGAGIAFDRLRAATILFGGLGSLTYGDTWQWDGKAWSRLALDGPAARSDVAMAFDGARERVVLFGGQTYDDTWELHTRGAACAASSECETFACVDGVCCETTTCGACEMCNLPSSPGVCAQVAGGDTPRCSGASSCNASGMCLGKNGVPCSDPSTCASGICDASGVCCATDCGVGCTACNQVPAGTCVVAMQGTPCGPYVCSGNSPMCPIACLGDGDCSPGFYCVAGACSKARPGGHPCTAGGDCQSGFCVDGVCCESACAGSCASCAQPGKLGSCVAFTSGDPRGRCAGEGKCAGSCGADGQCHFPSSTQLCDVCKACDGNGRCTQPPPDGDDPACSVIACGGLSSECVAFDELSAHRCVAAGSCALPNDPSTCVDHHNLPDGTPCSLGACMSGACVALPADLGTPSSGHGGCSFALH
jgi:hypothetical protein